MKQMKGSDESGEYSFQSEKVRDCAGLDERISRKMKPV
jgi:hypothetical protein